MLLADCVVLIGLSVAKLPLIQFMAEIQLTDAEEFLAGVVFCTTIVAFVSFPVWLIGAIVAFFRPRRWNIAAPGQRSGSRMVWLVAAGSVAAGLLALPWTQPELRLATRAESLLRGGRIEQALAMMSTHRRSDFPPQWEPPPRVGYGEQTPALLDVLEAMTQTPTADWVRQAYLSSFERVYLQGEGFDGRDGYTGLAACEKAPGCIAGREGSPREIRRANAIERSTLPLIYGFSQVYWPLSQESKFLLRKGVRPMQRLLLPLLGCMAMAARGEDLPQHYAPQGELIVAQLASAPFPHPKLRRRAPIPGPFLSCQGALLRQNRGHLHPQGLPRNGPR